MDGAPVSQRNHPQSATPQLRQYSPESHAIIALRFDPNWIADYLDTHLARQVRPLSQDFALEVPSKVKLQHDSFATSTSPRWSPFLATHHHLNAPVALQPGFVRVHESDILVPGGSHMTVHVPHSRLIASESDASAAGNRPAAGKKCTAPTRTK